MFAIGHDELERNGPVGDSVQCTKCDLRHPIEFGESVAADGTRTPSRLLAVYRCGEKMYLAAIDGFSVIVPADRRKRGKTDEVKRQS